LGKRESVENISHPDSSFFADLGCFCARYLSDIPP
jgi:hypothetical protein